MGYPERVPQLTLLQLELLDTGLVRGDGGALDTDAILLDGLGGLDGDLVVGLVTVLQTLGSKDRSVWGFVRGQALHGPSSSYQVVVLEIDVEVSAPPVSAPSSAKRRSSTPTRKRMTTRFRQVKTYGRMSCRSVSNRSRSHAEPHGEGPMGADGRDISPGIQLTFSLMSFQMILVIYRGWRGTGRRSAQVLHAASGGGVGQRPGMIGDRACPPPCFPAVRRNGRKRPPGRPGRPSSCRGTQIYRGI